MPYLHILQYGPGGDELFVPTAAVRRVAGNHIYLDMDELDLVASPWHEVP